MDVAVSSVPPVTGHLANGRRSFCGGLECPAPSVRVLAPAARGLGSERVFSELAGISGLRLSPIRSHSSMLGQTQERTLGVGSDLSPLAISGVVSSLVADVDRLPSHFPAGSTPDPLADARPSQSVAFRQVPTIRLEVIRQRYIKQGLSGEVIELLLGEIRDTTAATYQSAWSGWLDWNSVRDSDPLLPSIGSVLQYLTDLFRGGSAYSSLNVHRSMLSSTLDPVDGHKVGMHPLVVKLLKGCFNLLPPQPRYNTLWDPDVVLKYFDRLGANVDLSLVSLSRKVAMLLALSTVARVSELCSISFDSIQFSSAAVTFSFRKLRKAQKDFILVFCVVLVDIAALWLALRHI